MKKWTYLVVAGLLAGATPMLQSCVDNDEPEGINVLRKAKAELIAAKKIVQEAEAARLKAEAAKLEADAALVKAQAEIAKAAAELINAKTEGERADIEIRIAQAKAEAEHQQKVWEQEDKLAEVAYQTALAELAKVKAAVNAKQQKVLQAYITNVETKKAIYDEKMTAVRKAQRDWIKATETVEANEANKEILTFDLQQTLKEEKAWLEAIKEFIQYMDEEIAAASAMKPGDNVVRCEELQAEYDALQAKIVEAQKAVDLARAEMAPDYDELAALQAAANAALNAPIEIAEFKYEFPYYIVSGYQGEQTIVRSGSYNLNNDFWFTYNIGRVESAKNAIKRAARDENQNAWGAESLAMYKAYSKSQNAYVAQVKAEWQDAVNAYRTGTEYGTLKNLKGDAEAGIYGYAELLDAIKTYNDLVAPYFDAQAAYTAYVGTATPSQEYAAQRTAAWNKYDDLLNEHQEVLTNMQNEFDDAAAVRSADMNAKYRRWKELALIVTQKGEDATTDEITARDDAKSAYDKAVQDDAKAWDLFYGYNDVQSGNYIKGTKQKKEEEFAAAEQLALATYLRELADINLDETKNLESLDAARQEKAAELLAASHEAYGALDGARSDVRNIYSSLVNRVCNYSTVNSNLENALYNLEVFKVTEDLANVNKSNVEDKVRVISQELYGYYWDTNVGTNDRLVELTKADIDAQLAEEGVDPWNYISHYGYLENYGNEWRPVYGEFGLSLYYEGLIEQMEALLGVTDAQLAEMTADLQAEADKLVADYELAVAVAEEAQAAADKKQAEIDDALAELQAAVTKLQKDADYLNEVLLVYMDYAEGEMTQEAIDELVTQLGMAKVELEELQVEYEHAVKVAEKALADWNNGAIAAADFAKFMLDEAQNAADIAKENLDAATERLQKAIEAMAVAAE